MPHWKWLGARQPLSMWAQGPGCLAGSTTEGKGQVVGEEALPKCEKPKEWVPAGTQHMGHGQGWN